MRTPLKNKTLLPEGPVAITDQYTENIEITEQALFDDTLKDQYDNTFVTRDELSELFNMAAAEAMLDELDAITESIDSDEDLQPGEVRRGRVKPSTIFTLEQVRSVYDLGHMRRIGRSMAEKGQLQNCGVAYLDQEHAVDYLNKANVFFGTEVTVDELIPDEQGRYRIAIFGHNRILGARMYNIDQHGHEDIGMRMSVNLYDNIDFSDALEMQFIENTGLQPSLFDRAYRASMYVDLRTRAEGTVRMEAVAQRLNLSIEQLRDAVNYTSLPDSLRHLAEDETTNLSFSSVLAFASLLDCCSEKEIMDYAHTADAKKMSSAGVREMTKQVRAVRQLPEDIILMTQKGILPFERALKLRKLNGVVSEAELVQIVIDMVVNNFDVDEFERRIEREHNNSVEKQQSFFEEATENAQAAADARFWQKQYRGIIDNVRKAGFDSIDLYMTMLGQIMDGDVVDSAISAERIQEDLEKIAGKIGRLETLAVARDDEAWQGHITSLKDEIEQRRDSVRQMALQ